MLMMLLTVFFSIISTGIMSYLSMSTHLGPWVAPVFAVVSVAFIKPFFTKDWISRHLIIGIVGGSVGGMVGICIGFSFPSFYFMHRRLFEYWNHSPIYFSVILGLFVLIAASYSFLIAYILRNYFLIKGSYDFPMSKLIYEVIYVDKNKNSRVMMMLGMFISAIWNVFSVSYSGVLSLYSSYMHTAPLLSSIGFITGLDSSVYILLGLATRIFVLRIVHIYIPSSLTDHALLITFCSGMLVSWFVFYTHSLALKKSLFGKFKLISYDWFFYWVLATAFGCFVLLSSWGIGIFSMILTFLILMLIARYMIDIVSSVGVIEIDTYVWFLLLIFVYFVPTTSLSIVALSVFAMICLGLVVDFMFSYKLADLSDIDYKLIVKYQVVAVICSAATAGFWFYYISQHFGLGSFDLMAYKAHELDSIVRYGRYDYRVFFAGFVYAAFLRNMFHNVLTVAGGVLMSPFVSSVLITSGAIAHLIEKRERFYSICFGIYAGHMLWLILSALK